MSPEDALPPLIAPVLLASGVWQVVSPGPYKLNVTSPAGALPPEIVAVSETGPPRCVAPDAVVDIRVLAFLPDGVVIATVRTTCCSAVFAPVAAVNPGRTVVGTVTGSLILSLPSIVTLKRPT